MDIKPEAKMTFTQLGEWYLGLEKVKAGIVSVEEVLRTAQIE